MSVSLSTKNADIVCTIFCESASQNLTFTLAQQDLPDGVWQISQGVSCQNIIRHQEIWFICKPQLFARYALEGLPNKIMAAEYRVALPEEKLLIKEIEKTRHLLETHRIILHRE